MNQVKASTVRTNRGISALIKLILLVVAGIGAWWLDHRQAQFGERYAEAVLEKRTDLKIDVVDFKDDVAQVGFQVFGVPAETVTSVQFVTKLGNELRVVYCSLVKGNEFYQLKIPLLNVGVRYDERDHSAWVLSHAYSPSTCKFSS
jgi:hypothetical protein